MCAQPAAGHRYEHRARFHTYSRRGSPAPRQPAGTAQLAPEPAAPAYDSNLGLAYCTDKACLLVPDTGHQCPIGVPRPF